MGTFLVPRAMPALNSLVHESQNMIPSWAGFVIVSIRQYTGVKLPPKRSVWTSKQHANSLTSGTSLKPTIYRDLLVLLPPMFLTFTKVQIAFSEYYQ